MISITSHGDYRNTIEFLKGLSNIKSASLNLDKYGKMGVDALQSATPIDSSLTANSWKYRIVKTDRGSRIDWFNTNIVNGIPVAVLIQYGHATGNGAYISGRDFINPAIQPIFDKISEEIWKKVR